MTLSNPRSLHYAPLAFILNTVTSTTSIIRLDRKDLSFYCLVFKKKLSSFQLLELFVMGIAEKVNGNGWMT